MRQKERRLYTVRSDAPLSRALTVIDENHHRSVIVTSAKDIVVGTLSDGDVRKAMLDGRLLETPVSSVMNTRFISMRGHDKKAANRIFQDTHIFLIPVIDEKGRLVDVLKAY